MDATKCEALERFGFDWTVNVATAESEAEAVEAPAPAPAAMDMGMGVSPSPGTMGDSNSTVEDNANTSSFESSTVETAVPHQQAQARCRRIGQTKSLNAPYVCIYFFLEFNGCLYWHYFIGLKEILLCEVYKPSETLHRHSRRPHH